MITAAAGPWPEASAMISIHGSEASASSDSSRWSGMTS